MGKLTTLESVLAVCTGVVSLVLAGYDLALPRADLEGTYYSVPLVFPSPVRDSLNALAAALARSADAARAESLRMAVPKGPTSRCFYRISIKNTGNKPASDVALRLPAAATVYVRRGPDFDVLDTSYYSKDGVVRLASLGPGQWAVVDSWSGWGKEQRPVLQHADGSGPLFDVMTLSGMRQFQLYGQRKYWGAGAVAAFGVMSVIVLRLRRRYRLIRR